MCARDYSSRHEKWKYQDSTAGRAVIGPLLRRRFCLHSGGTVGVGLICLLHRFGYVIDVIS